MQNNVNSNISWYEGHTITSLGKILQFSKFYVQNIWQVVRWWHHQLTHLHIHIDWSRNVLWKFAKLQSVITSLFFNQFSSGFHCNVWKFLLFLLSLTKMLWSSSLRPVKWTLEVPTFSLPPAIEFHSSLVDPSLLFCCTNAYSCIQAMVWHLATNVVPYPHPQKTKQNTHTHKQTKQNKTKQKQPKTLNNSYMPMSVDYQLIRSILF